jgi:hypothetical protein
MGRATSFRVDIIKARFCNALLAQFSKDIKKEGTVSFRVRSQWDVASLARVFSTLGLRDKDEAEFRISDVHGSNIGGEFTAKALEVIDITGPLLIFCLLGGLILRAVPLDQSGVEPEDIKRVWELQRKVIDKERLRERLPLNSPSEKVWGNVGQMRKQVQDLLEKNAGKDREMKILQELLQMIDDVCSLRFSGSEGPGQGDPPEEQGRKTSIPANLTSSSDVRGISNQRSFASESTAFSGGGPSGGTPTSEGEVGFGRAGSLLIPRASIDFQPVNPADNVLDREKETYVRSDSPQSDESGSRSLPLRYATGTPGVGMMDRSSATSPSAIHFPYIGDARQRRFTRWTDSGFSGTRPSLATRASTSVIPTSRRDSPTIFPNPAIGSSYEPFDLSSEGQSSAGSSSGPLSPP